MVEKQIQCQHCGAQMLPAPDGRTFQCKYCGSQILVAVDAEQLAAGMKLDLSNVETFLQRLAQTMESTFTNETRVERTGARVASIQIDLGANLFVAQHDGRAVVAQHKKVVRGIALKTAAHPLDHWVSLLHAALAAHANENTRATEALTSLFGKRETY